MQLPPPFKTTAAVVTLFDSRKIAFITKQKRGLIRFYDITQKAIMPLIGPALSGESLILNKIVWQKDDQAIYYVKASNDVLMKYSFDST